MRTVQTARPTRPASASLAWLLWAVGAAIVLGAIVFGSRQGGDGDYASLAILLAPSKAAPYFGLVNLGGAIAGTISLLRPGRGAPVALALNAVGVLLALYAFAIHLAP